MASEVSICNGALVLVGGSLISSLNDESTESRVCNAIYPELRDALVEAHDWTFAITRFNLPASSAKPVNGYSVAYPIPSDILRVLDVNNGGDWRVEGESIVTNEGSCIVRAVARITDPTRFSSLFVQALSARIAADLAIPLAQSRLLQRDNYALYEAKLAEAVSNDGMQGKSRRITSSWLRASRRGGRGAVGSSGG